MAVQGREMGVERALEAYEHPLRTTATCAFKSSNHAAAKASYGFRAALWDARSSALTRRIKSSVASCWLSRRFASALIFWFKSSSAAATRDSRGKAMSISFATHRRSTATSQCVLVHCTRLGVVHQAFQLVGPDVSSSRGFTQLRIFRPMYDSVPTREQGWTTEP